MTDSTDLTHTSDTSDALPKAPPDPGYDWRCQRCGHQWRSRKPNAPDPKQCSKCHSSYWEIPRKGGGEVCPTKSEKPSKSNVRRPGKLRKKVRRVVESKAVSQEIAQEVAVRSSAAPLFGYDRYDGGSSLFEPIIYKEAGSPAPVTIDVKPESEFILPPPPHMRRTYTSSEPSPTPESFIRKHKSEPEPDPNAGEK